jgi:hypothetical protein
VLTLLLLVASSIPACAQTDVCMVTTYWVEEGAGSTSRFNIGEFNASPRDEQVTKSFQHQESGLAVRVGVEYFENSPGRIRLAIAFKGEPAAVFDEIDRAEAETFHGKNWPGMSVSKSIKIDKREYTYTLTCQKKRKKRA